MRLAFSFWAFLSSAIKKTSEFSISPPVAYKRLPTVDALARRPCLWYDYGAVTRIVVFDLLSLGADILSAFPSNPCISSNAVDLEFKSSISSTSIVSSSHVTISCVMLLSCRHLRLKGFSSMYSHSLIFFLNAKAFSKALFRPMSWGMVLKISSGISVGWMDFSSFYLPSVINIRLSRCTDLNTP